MVFHLLLLFSQFVLNDINKQIVDLIKENGGSAFSYSEKETLGIIKAKKILTEEEKNVFKTATEINQIWVIEHAHMRQQYVCQSQSVN